jgi:hypothetical protein
MTCAKLCAKLTAAFMAVFFMSACGLTPGGDSLRANTAIKGREAAAAALENAE